MHIKIQNYEMLNFENYSLIGSEKGICRIQSKKLIAAFDDLRAICETPVELETIESILTKHQLDKKHALGQLHEHLVIQTNLTPPYFEGVYILHGWDEHIERAREIFDQEARTPLTHLPLHQESIKKIKSANSLIVLLPSSQNTDSLKSIYFEIANTLPKSFIIAGYFSTNTFTVTQPYSTDLGNPCLFCSLSRAIHFETQANGSCAWNAILKFCTSNAVDFKSPRPYALQYTMAAGMISKKIRIFTACSRSTFFQDNILTDSAINLDSGVISEETLPHWHMCDCLRAPHAKYTSR